jgi:hypothetical protein
MRRATPLGHEQNAPANERESHPNPAPARPARSVEAEAPNADIQEQFRRPFSVMRGGGPVERMRSGEHHRRLTPVRATIQPSDPEKLRRALEAMRAMNKLTRRRTEDMRKLSTLSRELSEQMKEFGSVIGGLKIGPERKSAG